MYILTLNVNDKPLRLQFGCMAQADLTMALIQHSIATNEFVSFAKSEPINRSVDEIEAANAYIDFVFGENWEKVTH